MLHTCLSFKLQNQSVFQRPIDQIIPSGITAKSFQIPHYDYTSPAPTEEGVESAKVAKTTYPAVFVVVAAREDN